MYEQVKECSYNGCIHDQICNTDCDELLCDDLLYPIYSTNGMTCNDTCTFQEYNLSNSSY